MNTKFLILVLAFFTLYSCTPKKSGEKTESTMEQDSVSTEAMPKLIITPVESSMEFQDAKLTMKTPKNKAVLTDGKLHFSYGVENYTLGSQTEDADIKQCANSAQGQHIHLILNNEPYTAHYEAEFDKELAPGHYTALSFISRSYHESIKTKDAYVLRQFTVSNTATPDEDLSGPTLFYSRPKGEYSGADTKKILLDFYLVNTDLSPEGNKIRATINEQEFILDRWVPYFVEGLPMGENTFKLELLDKDGNGITGPYNVVERTITLKE